MNYLRPRAFYALALLLVIGLLVASVVVMTQNGEGTPTVTVHVDGADKDRKADDTLKVSKPAVDQAQAAMEYSPQNLHGRPSPKTEKIGTPAQLKQRAAALKKLRARAPPLSVVGASQGFPGCVTRFVVNQSSRVVRPTQFWVHYTASPNRAGWSDVNAIVALFDRPSFQASSHFVIDNEGHCAYIVPIERKAWTQAGANSIGVNVEYINSGSEGRYCAPAGCAKLRKVALEVRHRTGIPVGQIGAVRNCSSARGGTVTHWMGGPCSGGHVDIKPYLLGPLVAYFRSGGTGSVLTKDEQKIIRGSASPKGTGHSRSYWCARNTRQRAAIRDVAHRSGGYRTRHRGTRYQLLGKSFNKRCH